MKYKIAKRHIVADVFASLAVFSVLAGLLAVPRLTSAADGTRLYVSPSSQSVAAGGNTVISVIIDTAGESVNTVQSVITYDAAKFSFVSIVPGSAFSAAFPNSHSDGSVQFSAGSLNGLTGQQTVATLTLTAKASGSSSVTLAGVCPPGNYAATCSAAYDSVTSNNVLGQIAAGSFNVAGGTTSAPAPSPTPTPAPASSSGSKPSSSTKPTSSQPTVTASSPAATASTKPAPVISGLTISDITDTSAIIRWQTNVPATSMVQFGLSDKYGQTVVADGLTITHEVIIKAPYLAQGSTYYIQAISTSADGVSSSSAPQKFFTKGFSITLQILDEDNQPLANATVICAGRTLRTDSAGNVTCDNVPAGTQKITVQSDGATTVRTITVGKRDPHTGTYAPQKFSLTAASGKPTNAYLVFGLAILLVVVAWLCMPNGPIRRLFSRNSSGPTGDAGMTGGDSGAGPPVSAGPTAVNPGAGAPAILASPPTPLASPPPSFTAPPPSSMVPNEREIPSQIITPDVSSEQSNQN